MQGGDISNELPPRWLVQFEGVIGVLPTPHLEQTHRFYARIHAHKHAVTSLRLNPHISAQLWDLTWRKDYKFDVITFLPLRMAEHVKTWLKDHNVPAANVWRFASPAVLSRQLAYMPDVFAVIHADEASQFTYGNRGVLVGGERGWTI